MRSLNPTHLKTDFCTSVTPAIWFNSRPASFTKHSHALFPDRGNLIFNCFKNASEKDSLFHLNVLKMNFICILFPN